MSAGIMHWAETATRALGILRGAGNSGEQVRRVFRLVVERHPQLLEAEIARRLDEIESGRDEP